MFRGAPQFSTRNIIERPPRPPYEENTLERANNFKRSPCKALRYSSISSHLSFKYANLVPWLLDQNAVTGSFCLLHLFSKFWTLSSQA